MSYPNPPVEVRRGEEPAARCSRCDRPFDSEHARDLHVGEVHADDLSDDERTAYEAAIAEERDELWLFHAKVVAALGAIYAVTVILYLVALQGGLI